GGPPGRRRPMLRMQLAHEDRHRRRAGELGEHDGQMLAAEGREQGTDHGHDVARAGPPWPARAQRTRDACPRSAAPCDPAPGAEPARTRANVAARSLTAASAV